MATTYLKPEWWKENHTGGPGVWLRWNHDHSATTSGTLTLEPWTTWTSNSTTTTTGSTLDLRYDPAYTWEQWDRANQAYLNKYRAYPRHEPTQDELDAAQRRREEESARALAARTRLQGAEERALGLLRDLLSPDQIATFDADGEIWVKGSEGGLYVIETRAGVVHGNIRSVDAHGCMLGRLCVQPGMWDPTEEAALPTSDGYVGQLLGIRFNEPALLAKANWSSIRRCQQPTLRAA